VKTPPTFNRVIPGVQSGL